MAPAMKKVQSQTDFKKNKVRKILYKNIKNSKKLARFLNNDT
jgi:hypothetical protein